MTIENEKEQPKRGRGRPKEENTYNLGVRIRVSERDMDKIKQITEATGDSMSDAIRIGIHGYWVHLIEKGMINVDR